MTISGFSPDTPAPEVLAGIQALFRELDIFEQRLTLTYQGRQYLASCDAHAFAVYRLNPHCHVPPGAPGWPVCLVTGEMAVDETGAPCLEEDEFSSELSLRDWLDLITKTFAK